jgi:poly(hydroxyalkanoate) granule-associated protein
MTQTNGSTQLEMTQLSTLQDEVSSRGRAVWLAGLGALATVEDQGSKLFASLIEQGKSLEAEGRERIAALRRQAVQQGEETIEQVSETRSEAESLLTRAVDEALDRLGLASRSEVDRLTQKIGALSEQVDELTRSLENSRHAG